ncbi:atrial natriuretic peptide receptor 1-like isoform X2 [Glandiceps talaboti]
MVIPMWFVVTSAIVLVSFQTQYVGCQAEVHSARIAVILPKANDSSHSSIVNHVISRYPFRLQMCLPAIDIAVEKVLSTPYYFGERSVNITVSSVDSEASNVVAPIRAVEYLTEKTVDVFFGPCNEYAVAPVARFARHWKIPMITTALAKEYSTVEDLSNVTRPQGSYMKAVEALAATFRHFKYNVTTLIHVDWEVSEYRDCWFFGAALNSVIPPTEGGYNDFDESKETDYAELLKTAVIPHGRIVVICASGEAVRKIMLAAHGLGMTTPNKDGHAQYVFFNIQLFDSAYFGSVGWEKGDEHDADAKQAYRSLMTLTLRKPDTPEYNDFAKEVKMRALRDYQFDYDKEGEGVNSFVGAFHDAVLLYAIALNETLEAGGSARDGEEITRRMWNRTFQGISGQVSIDSNGDRDADYSLLEMTDTENGVFTVIANYYGTRKKYEPVKGAKIDWPGEHQPVDVPACGFQGEFCQEKELSLAAIISIVFGCLIAALAVVAFLLYRKYKLEAALADMAWKVRWEEIGFNQIKRSKMGSVQSLQSKRSSIHSNQSVWDLNQQIFTRTGYYKSNVVAIKRINKRRIELTRQILLELKHMRDVQHDHVTRFIGACTDPPNICVLTEYCPKGSLQDILENDSIKLDWMFRYSLMSDIVKGMYYLHTSVIGSHGNLKSSNCVVDSRFVLKVTDYGLNFFKQESDDIDEEYGTHQYYQRLLWTAPEILRMNHSPLGGTPKGDVYSFGVIIQEIVHRCGPFYVSHMDLSPEEIVQKVRAASHKPYFRPSVDRATCPDNLFTVMEKCWAEDPNDRPDFNSLRSILRKTNESATGNILDNLLQRMEQYANNLESLVEERTEAFYEEKRRAEELLYQVLPKSVAEKLKRGEVVKAEAFECVTIFFSDIVGFTSLSASSTPMEVVSMLNDLYTCFDAIIDNFNVYKVETIGDAYMVVSGLPIRNGDYHAREIARMAIALLYAVENGFRIKHKPDAQLKLRIGIHSGMVCAGVVGLKMPRYCLFGDTVNTASRMESNGLPLKIHMSEQTNSILSTFKTFIITKRGEVEMKGKGKQITYWLDGEEVVEKKINGDIPRANHANYGHLHYTKPKNFFDHH